MKELIKKEVDLSLVKDLKAGKACFQELEKLLPSYRVNRTKSISNDYLLNISSMGMKYLRYCECFIT